MIKRRIARVNLAENRRGRRSNRQTVRGIRAQGGPPAKARRADGRAATSASAKTESPLRLNLRALRGIRALEDFAAITPRAARRLIELDLGSTDLKDADLRELISRAEAFKNLRTLRLGNNPITSAALAGIDRMTSLKELHLDRTDICDQVFAHLSPMGSRLQWLDVSSCRRIGRRADRFALIQNLNGLRTLDLSYAAFDDVTAAESLRHLPNVEVLRLGGTAVGEQTMRFWSEAGHELQALELYYCPGIVSLAFVRNLLPRLRTLNVEGCDGPGAGLGRDVSKRLREVRDPAELYSIWHRRRAETLPDVPPNLIAVLGFIKRKAEEFDQEILIYGQRRSKGPRHAVTVKRMLGRLIRLGLLDHDLRLTPTGLKIWQDRPGGIATSRPRHLHRSASKRTNA